MYVCMYGLNVMESKCMYGLNVMELYVWSKCYGVVCMV